MGKAFSPKCKNIFYLFIYFLFSYQKQRGVWMMVLLTFFKVGFSTKIFVH